MRILVLSIFFILLQILTISPKAYAKKVKVAVVSSQIEATQVGMDILKSGGSAADALVAMALTLSVVEPQHSGLGGGGVTLYFDANSNRFTSFDYTPIAPFLASENEFVINKIKCWLITQQL